MRTRGKGSESADTGERKGGEDKQRERKGERAERERKRRAKGGKAERTRIEREIGRDGCRILYLHVRTLYARDFMREPTCIATIERPYQRL